jgi:hypothetical protein
MPTNRSNRSIANAPKRSHHGLKKCKEGREARAASLPESFSQERSTDKVSEGGRYLLATTDDFAAESSKARFICCPARIRGSEVARYN